MQKKHTQTCCEECRSRKSLVQQERLVVLFVETPIIMKSDSTNELMETFKIQMVTSKLLLSARVTELQCSLPGIRSSIIGEHNSGQTPCCVKHHSSTEMEGDGARRPYARASSPFRDFSGLYIILSFF